MRVFILLLLSSSLAVAEPGDKHSATLLVAVAANFSRTMHIIAEEFEQATLYKVTIATGSTSKHYAQIHQGAPFDIFFAADNVRPALLEQQGLAKQRFTYAIGHIVLWSPIKNNIDLENLAVNFDKIRYLAIANPRWAPYGLAAQQVLQANDLWKNWQSKLVMGRNINETLQFIIAGHADLGFIALSQLRALSLDEQGAVWLVPSELYTPIQQQAVLLTDKLAAKQFVEFMQQDKIRILIKNAGYSLP